MRDQKDVIRSCTPKFGGKEEQEVHADEGNQAPIVGGECKFVRYGAGN